MDEATKQLMELYCRVCSSLEKLAGAALARPAVASPFASVRPEFDWGLYGNFQEKMMPTVAGVGLLVGADPRRVGLIVDCPVSVALNLNPENAGFGTWFVQNNTLMLSAREWGPIVKAAWYYQATGAVYVLEVFA